MKNFCIFLCVLGFTGINTNTVHAQSDTLFLYQTYHSFSNQEKAEWTAFENNWNYVDYTNLKQKNNIKSLNCKNCGSFYADIYIEINNEGKLQVTRFIKGKKCGLTINDKVLINQFENSNKSHSFNYIKNKKFIARFGHILKC